MLIAQAKRKENIIEYFLYMYQIEDIIRSLNYDMDRINELIISGFDQSDTVKERIYQWYLDLSESLIKEGKKSSGHLNFLMSELKDIQKFHTTLLTVYQDKQYQKLFEEAKPVLKDLVMRSGGKSLINEIDVAINGVYGYLVLKLKKVPISNETEEGVGKIKSFLAYLALQYKQLEEGKLDLNSSEN